ncbi:phage/plasmid replication domain-containing protein [Sphingobacterium spiritivorum]|uniref:phage/plasmid replication domain-containing protein n=1 Tax=Sphingobacterium spiritivorum TaxID=258 RepID=UPI003DA20A74
MLDTIVLRIHNLKSKYQYYVNFLQDISKEDNRVIKYNSNNVFKDDVQTYQHYSDTSKIRFLSLRSAIYVPSSHYSVVYNTNHERDYLEINLSIPKYIFGTNIFQFTDRRDIDTAQVWNKFDRWINEFLIDFFPTSPDYVDVEINRVDMCLNQIFLTKEDALKYLSQQKTLQLYHARSDKNRFNSYGNKTISYVTSNYSFKIYHKGTEFRKNDYKELCKNNPKNYDLELLADVADRTLRYEITYRKSGLNYVYKQSVITDINTMVNHNFERLSMSKMRANREFVNKIASGKCLRFSLSSLWDNPTSTLFDLVNSESFTFDYELFSSLYQFFKKRIDVYQLSKKLTPDEMLKKVDNYMEREFALNGKKYDKSNIVVLATLTQYIDYKDLKSILPRTTYYRNQKLLKDVGIELNTIDDIYSAPLDFSEYFNLLGKYHNIYN